MNYRVVETTGPGPVELADGETIHGAWPTHGGVRLLVGPGGGERWMKILDEVATQAEEMMPALVDAMKPKPKAGPHSADVRIVQIDDAHPLHLEPGEDILNEGPVYDGSTVVGWRVMILRPDAA